MFLDIDHDPSYIRSGDVDSFWIAGGYAKHKEIMCFECDSREVWVGNGAMSDGINRRQDLLFKNKIMQIG